MDIIPEITTKESFVYASLGWLQHLLENVESYCIIPSDKTHSIMGNPIKILNVLVKSLLQVIREK